MFLVPIFFNLNSIVSVREHSDGKNKRCNSKWLKPDVYFRLTVHMKILISEALLH